MRVNRMNRTTCPHQGKGWVYFIQASLSEEASEEAIGGGEGGDSGDRRGRGRAKTRRLTNDANRDIAGAWNETRI